MSWVKLDDGFYDHRKVVAAGAHGLALWVVGLAYCNRQPQRDGFIPDGKVDCLFPIPKARSVAAKLVEVGLWERVEGGYQVHDYHDFQPDSERAAEISAKRAEAGRRGGKRSGEARTKQIASPVASTGEATVARSNEANANPVPVPVPEERSGERSSRAHAPDGVRGVFLLPSPIPAREDLGEPTEAVVSLASTRGCVDLAYCVARWHTNRWARRGERKTWRTDWWADCESWFLEHQPACAGRGAATRLRAVPAAAPGATVRDFTGITAEQLLAEQLDEDAKFQAEMARRDAARATPPAPAAQAAGGAA